jgi:hypothetical protein
MKLRHTLLVAAMLMGSAAFGQVEDPNAPPSEVPETTEVPAPTDMPPAEVPSATVPAGTAPVAATARPGKAAPPIVKHITLPDTIKGNARFEVSFMESEANCSPGMKGLFITNKSETRPIKVRVDVAMLYNGRMSKKSILVDNLAPKEVRAIGCQGCIDKPTGKACSTYKIIAAAYKE